MHSEREKIENSGESDQDTSLNKSFPELPIKDNISITK